MKRKTVVLITSLSVGAAIVLGTTWYFLAPKNKIKLDINNLQLTWIDESKENKININYEIYNDKYKVGETTKDNFMLSEENLIDEQGPEAITNVNLDYGKENIGIILGNIKDIGSDNKISVKTYSDSDRLITYSNAISLNYISGLDKFYVSYLNNSFNTKNSQFSIERAKLKEGLNKLTIYSMDKRGNKSQVSQIPIYNYSLILNSNKGTAILSANDKTQEYSYNFYIDDAYNSNIKTIDELNAYLKDTLVPDNVSKIVVKSKEKEATIYWDIANDKENIYKIKVEGTGSTYKNIAYSNSIFLDKASGIKGYYYFINNKENYTVTNKDTFTNKAEINTVLPYSTYYVHIAAVDNSGNLSATETKKFTLTAPVIEQPLINPGNLDTQNLVVDKYKADTIKSMLVRGSKTTDETYNLTVYLISQLPYHLLDLFSENNLKIYIADNEAETLYKEQTGGTVTGISGIFYWVGDKSSLIFESKNIYKSLYHELGHAADYFWGDKQFITAQKNFIDIYKSEKDKLFPTGHDYEKSSEKEYFAEAFQIYFLNNNQLKTSAPKTYSFIEQYIL